MSAARSPAGPTLGLLYGATFWGFVWYPSRLLEAAGLAGPWLMLAAYATVFIAFAPFARHSLGEVRRQPVDILVLVGAAGWTNTAFVLAVLEGEVVRVVLLFYLSPLWTVMLGRWLLDEALTWRTGLMLGLGLSGALVMHNAEVLAGIVLAQAANQGAPVIYGSSSTRLDMKQATAVVGVPEMAMISAGAAELANFYGIPSYVAGG